MTILRVNLSNASITTEDSYPNCWGRELIAKVLTHEVNPKCHPLDKENKIIIANGPLAGTGVSSCGRLSVGGKSPLTGGIKESNSGGMAANYLARWGIRGIIVEGESEGLCTLLIGNEIKLNYTNEYFGMRTGEVTHKCKDLYGEETSVICIGPAGDYKMLAAGIAVTDTDGRPSRYAARGGLGAVLGSKKLKAIAIKKPPLNKKVKIADNELFKNTRKTFHQVVLKNPVTGHLFPYYGTAFAVDIVQELGGLPTHNFSNGRFKDASKLSAESLRETIIQRAGKGKTSHSCMTGCIVKCSNVFPDKDGNVIVSPLEYETIGLMGSNLGIGSLDEIATLNHECNELGLDTIETGAAMGLIMDEGIIEFGDFDGAMNMLNEIKKKSYLGRIIGNGVEVAAKVFGNKRVPAAKGQAIPAYDPRAIKGFGVTYASSPMGADHTAGYTLPAKINHHAPEGQLELSSKLQLIRATLDAWGVCAFLQAALAEDWSMLTNMVNGAQGTQYEPDYIQTLGKSIINLEKNFNYNAGIVKGDAMPAFMRTEPLPPFDLVFDVKSEEIDAMLNED